MGVDNFKNTIVLKNIESNIVDEAILVLKENKKAWKLQKIESKKSKDTLITPMKKEHIVKEAELVIFNYLNNISDKEKSENIKYKRLKKYAYIITAMLLIQVIINLLI